jgi:hypothetical protein
MKYNYVCVASTYGGYQGANREILGYLTQQELGQHKLN